MIRLFIWFDLSLVQKLFFILVCPFNALSSVWELKLQTSSVARTGQIITVPRFHYSFIVALGSLCINKNLR